MLLYAWWFWLFLALILFWFLGAYNRMVKLRASACQSYFTLETLLMKYQDLVQEAITAAATAPYGWRSAVTLGDISGIPREENQLLSSP